MDAGLRASLAAGAAAGAAGIILFSVVHWLVIFPTWDTLTAGLPVAILAGLPLGWAFHELRGLQRLPPGVLGAVAYAALLLLVLAVVDAAAFVTGAVPFAQRPDGIIEVDTGRVLADLFVAIPTGLLLGWVLTRQRKATLAVALAALAITLSLGHNIPAFPAGPQGGKMWAVMALVTLACAMLLAGLRSRFLEVGSVGA